MLGLKLPTDPRWVELVDKDISAILSDHAWCEQKAASNAISLIVRYPDHIGLVEELTRIAQEEIAHFGMVVERIKARGLELEPERKDHYVNELLTFVRKEGTRAQRLVDRLLFSAMIEARSCERFTRLLEVLRDSDPEVARLLADLGPAEKRHWQLFYRLAGREVAPEALAERFRGWLELDRDLALAAGVLPTVHG